MTTTTVIQEKSAMRRLVESAHDSGDTTCVIMTMGALHEGHLSLVRAGCSRFDRCFVTIFVNPTQFLPGEDFDAYPRRRQKDLDLLNSLPVSAVFAPKTSEVYADNFSTYIDPPDIAKPWEGVARPGHFRGVCTVVFKLLQCVPAGGALFGQKDYQQYLVLRGMAADLDLPVQIDICPTVREPDGLAMSSRNQYLSASERFQALSISRGLRMAADLAKQGMTAGGTLRDAIRAEMTASGIHDIDYVAIVDAETLVELPEIDRPAISLVAARVGSTRLIDNWLLPDVSVG